MRQRSAQIPAHPCKLPAPLPLSRQASGLRRAGPACGSAPAGGKLNPVGRPGTGLAAQGEMPAELAAGLGTATAWRYIIDAVTWPSRTPKLR